jgi:hypothetical protein
MDENSIAYVIALIEGWYDPSVPAPTPPEPRVAFLREIVVGLQELPAGDTEIDARVHASKWVMERQSVTTDKDGGIAKDANAVGPRRHARLTPPRRAEAAR